MTTQVNGNHNDSILNFTGAKDDEGGGDNYSYKTCKASVRSSPPTNEHLAFYRTDALPVVKPTVSKHWREALKDHYATKIQNITALRTYNVHTIKYRMLLKGCTASYFLRGSLTAGSCWPASEASSTDDRNENWNRRRGFGDGGDAATVADTAAIEHSIELLSRDRNSPRRDRQRPMHAKSAHDGSVLCCNCYRPTTRL